MGVLNIFKRRKNAKTNYSALSHRASTMTSTIKIFSEESKVHSSNSEGASTEILEPQEATDKELDKQSALHLNVPNQGPVLLRPKEAEAGDYLTEAIERLGLQVNKTDEALLNSKSESGGNSLLEKLKYEEELKKTKDALEEVTLLLQEERLKAQKKDKEHAAEIKEKEQALDSQVSLLKNINKKNSKLEELKKEYDKDYKKFEEMRERLAAKEKQIRKVQKELESLQMKEQNYSLIIDKKQAEEQIKLCSQIRELLSKLPHISLEEQTGLMKEIATDVSKMKACSSGRSTSWKQ